MSALQEAPEKTAKKAACEERSIWEWDHGESAMSEIMTLYDGTASGPIHDHPLHWFAGRRSYSALRKKVQVEISQNFVCE